jgi:tetratricopeptide (TPR) repeat protein
MLRRSLFLPLIPLSVLAVAAMAQTNPGVGTTANVGSTSRPRNPKSLCRRGRQTDDTARLEADVAAYREALQKWPRTRVPLQWAGTQMGLGSALRALGEREAGTARLEEAVAAYREALQELTRARMPLDWAGTQRNLGVALLRLGERESGTARLEAPSDCGMIPRCARPECAARSPAGPAN